MGYDAQWQSEEIQVTQLSECPDVKTPGYLMYCLPFIRVVAMMTTLNKGSLHGFERSPLLSALLCAMHCLWQQLPYKQPIKRWVTILIWYMRKLRLRRIKKVSANHWASKWQGWDLSPRLFDFQAQALVWLRGCKWEHFQGWGWWMRNRRFRALADSFQIQNSKKHCVGKTKQNLLLIPVFYFAALI